MLVSGGAAGEFDLDMNASGEAIVSYVKPNGSYLHPGYRMYVSRYDVYVSFYRNGEWTNDSQPISPYHEYGASSTVVQIADSGLAFVAWKQSDGDNDQIFISSYADGVWVNPSSNSSNLSPDSQDAQAPQLTANDQGQFILTWSQPDGVEEQVFLGEYR